MTLQKIHWSEEMAIEEVLSRCHIFRKEYCRRKIVQTKSWFLKQKGEDVPTSQENNRKGQTREKTYTTQLLIIISIDVKTSRSYLCGKTPTIKYQRESFDFHNHHSESYFLRTFLSKILQNFLFSPNVT